MDGRLVVVVGGSGFYGRYLVEDLLRHTDASVLVVSRRPAASTWFRSVAATGRVRAAVADHADLRRLTALVADARAVVHCAGPYQAMPGGDPPLGPVRAAIAARVAYVDLSEDRLFRQHVLELAKDAGAAVLTGASVVPGLQAIAVADLARDLDEVTAVRCAAAPDTRRHRGDAMFRAMLHGAGLPFLAPRGGRPTPTYGWSEPERVVFPPPIGRRRVYQVYEMADIDVLTDLCGAGTVSFKAGSEFSWLNRALGLAAAVRARSGLPRRPERFTAAVRGLSWLAGRFGNESGGFMVEVDGLQDGRQSRRALGMTAGEDGGRIPSLLAGIAVERILAGRFTGSGVIPLHTWLPAEQLWAALTQRQVTLWRRDNGNGWESLVPTG
jgi:hypothetical protein